jgi:aspartate/methionine/tyrosine aminotransferase
MALANMSTRAQTLNDLFSHITPYYSRMNSNHYNKKTNPTGILNFAKAENMLCEKEIAEKLNTIQKWTVTMNNYGNSADEIELPQALCSFFEKNLRIDKQKLTVDRMMITGGADGAFIVYSYWLADPGDVMLIPSPYYSLIDLNVSFLIVPEPFLAH